MSAPAAAPATTPDRRRWLGLVVISLAVALIIVDSTIVNVAIPSIVADLDIGSTLVQWVQESYTLVFAALLLVFGSVADRFGRRRLLTTGVIVFAVASVLAALSPTGELLVVSRVLQGIGGAMVLPTTLSILNATFTGRERGIAFAVWGSTIGGMVAVGPLLGGWLTTDFSWRWAFGINVPIVAVILVGLAVAVRESRDARHTGRIDLVGALLSVIASAALVFGLIEGRTYGWWTPSSTPLTIGSWSWDGPVSPIPVAFVIAVAAGAAFVVRSLRRQRAGRSTLIALDLFRIGSFRNGSVAALIVSLGEFGIILSLPLWLQNVLGYSALQTGFVLLALAIGSFVASGFAATIGQRVGALPIVRMGIGAEIVGVAAIGFVVTSSTPWWAIVPCLFVYGFGVGLATAQLTGVVLQDVPVERSGEASGARSTARQIGSALGIAVLGTVLFTSTGSILEHRLQDAGTPAATATKIADAVVQSSGGAISGLDGATRADAADAFSDGTRAAAFSAAGFLVIGLGATLRLRAPRRPDDEDQA
ncbi:MFS transporter [Curtobacterium flaccumfaciens]|uniref:MFS transporter n=1 Tax=Curtobacterium flaccumfaciens TaxID=2035 RepID=UPI00217D4AC7|nr:MFS transporter [Curtobacterium flaccumfaciens]MCS6558393.1 MFS transporter [Curtobacterium flaccumfaciens]